MKFLAGLFFLATVLADRVAVVDLKTYGKIAFYQQAVNGSEMCISFNLTNLNGSASGYHVHQNPIGANEYACGPNVTGGHYDYGAEPGNIMNSLIATDAPTDAPTAPTVAPTPAPTAPTPAAPTDAPTAPTASPTDAPTTPTPAPTDAPTAPTPAPTDAPTAPTPAPTDAPTAPTAAPTDAPTVWLNCPTQDPTLITFVVAADECCPNAKIGGGGQHCCAVEPTNDDCCGATADTTWIPGTKTCCDTTKTLVIGAGTDDEELECCPADLPSGDNSALTACPTRRRRLLEVEGNTDAAANLVGQDNVEVTWCFTPPRADLFDDFLDRSVVVHKADGGARWFCGDIVEVVAAPTDAENSGGTAVDSAAPVSAPQFFFISFLFVFLRL